MPVSKHTVDSPKELWKRSCETSYVVSTSCLRRHFLKFEIVDWTFDGKDFRQSYSNRSHKNTEALCLYIYLAYQSFQHRYT